MRSRKRAVAPTSTPKPLNELGEEEVAGGRRASWFEEIAGG